MVTKVKLTAAQKKELIEKGQRNKPGPKPGSKRKPAEPVAQEPPPAPELEPEPVPAPEPPPPAPPDPPQPPQPVAVLQQLTADDIMNEIDATFKAHNATLAQAPVPVAEVAANGPATQQNTIVANPVNPAAQVAQAGNAANDALTRLIDPELIILACDLLLSNLLTVVFRKVAKFDVKQKDFALTGAERRDIGTLLDGWMKSRQKSIMTPGWALLMGVAGVYSGKGVSLIGADKIKPVAPPPVALEPGAEAAPAQTMANAYQDMITRQNTELLNTLQVMQSKIESLDKKVNSAAKKRTGNQNAKKKGTVLPLNNTGT